MPSSSGVGRVEIKSDKHKIVGDVFQEVVFFIFFSGVSMGLYRDLT